MILYFSRIETLNMKINMKINISIFVCLVNRLLGALKWWKNTYLTAKTNFFILLP